MSPRTTISMLLALTTLGLVSCGQQQPAAEIDPALGRACFDAHLPTLPPGSQYEGIAGGTAERIRIRSMTGTRVETFDCSLGAEGEVEPIDS
ncbi:hypothetical protein [Halochromatium glycolicum]|uniref:Lipoprotein n=1 Tax=Halochromatium glycolicum TaxID=85075 RepID=A0AAJ0U2P2_9GAMM|nr:hypothetical protein [Halochromatium glycolicum]MBK1704186.1 hypothetical protein [Halochromatium glycolicum]